MRFMDTLAILKVSNKASCIIIRSVHTINSLNDVFYGDTSYIKGVT